MSEALAGLPNAQLLARVRELVRRDNAVEAELLVNLAEVDARQLFLEEGCSSMFAYCQRVLQFAEGVAYKRILAARATRRHPQLLGALRSGQVYIGSLGGDDQTEMWRHFRAFLGYRASLFPDTDAAVGPSQVLIEPV